MKKIMMFVLLAMAAFAPVAVRADQPAYIFADGFEFGNLCKWDNTCLPPLVQVQIAYVDSDAVSPVGGNEAQANFELDMRVTVMGGDIYIEKSTQRDDTPDGSDGAEFVLRDGSNIIYTGGAVSSTLTADGSTSGDTPTHYKVADGAFRTIHLLVILNNNGGTAGYYRLNPTAISFDFDGMGVAADGGVIGFPPSFGTSTVYVGNQDFNN